jgi:hypothetical protein
MDMRDCHSRNTSRLARKLSCRVRARILKFAAAIACCAALVVHLHAQQQADSGWAFSTQQPFTLNSKQVNLKQQMTLDHLLEQIESPLLKKPPHPLTGKMENSPERAATSAQGSVRFAARPDGVDGWHAVGPGVAPLPKPVRTDLRAPQLNAPSNEPPTADVVPNFDEEAHEEDELDCGEHETEAEERAAVESSEAGLNDESSDLPADEIESPETSEAPVEEDADEAPAEEAAEQPAEQPTDQSVESESSPRTLPEVGPIEDEPKVEPVKKTPPPPLTKQLMSLRSRVRGVLKGYYRRQLNSRENDPWEVMHGMLAYGVHSRIRQGGPRGAPVASVGWLCYNKPCKNLTLMYVTPKGELRAKYGVGLQGHLGQLLAMLAQCRVSDEYPIRVGKREFTIKDLIEAEQKTCYPKSELTFKLLAFQYYLDLNDTWVNDQGVDWDLSKLIREELAQPIRGAACGGTHRLSSLSLAVKARERRGEPLDGEYARAAAFVQKYHRYAFSLQNRDGSLSTEWFRGRGDDSDIDRRIKTTGHILEWLCYSLSDEELRQPRTIAAVNYLTNLMIKEYDNEWEVGPMSHATHALLLYDERVFQPFDNENYSAVYKPARKSNEATARRTQSGANRR